ncbi:MAG: translocase [Gammaproteobacteria bacterium]|nr:MAG: translocase [Gammaproteobacteria bacterium]
MIKQFANYTLIGIVNTGIHWLCFFILHAMAGVPQSMANLCAFICAVVFSFFMNAKFTFQAKTDVKSFISFSLFMAAVSWLVGFYAEHIQLHPLATLIIFSAMSLVLGFIYAKFIVFRRKK